MRIAVVAPLMESVPPKLYGGTERVASYLTEELVRQGHDVTLFASGDSVTRARLRAVVPQGLRLDPGCRDPMAYHVMLVNLKDRSLLSDGKRFPLTLHFEKSGDVTVEVAVQKKPPEVMQMHTHAQ